MQNDNLLMSRNKKISSSRDAYAPYQDGLKKANSSSILSSSYYAHKEKEKKEAQSVATSIL